MAKTESAPETIDQKVEEFAEDLGRLLGTAKVKAESWLGQRGNITSQLREIRDTAVRLLGQLDGGAEQSAGRRQTSAGAPTAKSQGATPAALTRSGRNKPTMSPEARERIRQAQLKRWAKVRADGDRSKVETEGPRSRSARTSSLSVKRGAGRPKGSGRRKRTFSAESRERMRQAQLKRWAKQRNQ
jgi:hypothetical protein